MREVIGHEKILDRFVISNNKNALSHAHLIVGEDGIGKSLLAKAFAEKILGIDEKDEHVDIIHYRTNENSFKIANVREVVSEVNKKPYEGDRKVIILYNGEKFTIEAQNALLKTIEEPPVGVYIIILTKSLELILDTVKSRCQIHKLAPLNSLDLEKFIKRDFNNIDDDLKKSVMAFSEGIPGRIEKFINDKSFSQIRDFVLKVFYSAAHRNEKDIMEYTKYFDSKSKGEIAKALNGKNDEILETFVLFTRDIIVCKEVANKSFIINSDKFEEISKLAMMVSYKKLKGFISIIDEARTNLISNTNRALTFNEMMRKMLEA